ncbi:hypothetical protein [Streptomyces griseoaurantiacus]|uniref:hypothetical protein n=1 Tax=Streptomyces griseoaurantiacus TaxID=68213 RepID=UPI0017817211|nr:hypothetical protein GCM10018782_64290 [Streptomyces griseoaurantiacus]
MAGALGSQVSGVDEAWPWERPAGRARGWTAVSGHLGRVWSLSVLATMVLAGGYAWLGFFVGGVPGALIGAAAGLVTSGVLHLAVNRAVSGPR